MPPQRAVSRANRGALLLGSHHFSRFMTEAETAPIEFKLLCPSVSLPIDRSSQNTRALECIFDSF